MADTAPTGCAEEWRVVKEFPDYEVSSLGNVRNARGRVLKFRYDRGGYRRLALVRDGVVRHRMVHRLVAFAFIGPGGEGMEINHKDCCRTNNVPSNLEWVTREENAAHRLKFGKSGRGAANANAKLTQEKVDRIRSLYGKGPGMYELARQFGVSQSMISCIIRRKNWT